MTDQPVGLRPPSDPSRRPAPASRLVRALYTHNPFYVISADLVFIGLRMSFDPSAKAFDTWALISSLAALHAPAGHDRLPAGPVRQGLGRHAERPPAGRDDVPGDLIDDR